MKKNNNNRPRKRSIGRFFLVMMMIALWGFLARPGPTPAQEIPPVNGSGQTISLPLILKWSPLKGIHGQVTQGGDPILGIALQLKFWNGTAASTYAKTTTDGNGLYSFTDIPSLTNGQYYYVQYENPGDSGRLANWSTRSLRVYAGNEAVHIGDFDLADIPLVTPAANAEVKVPASFHWTRRPATSSDNYVLMIGT